MSPAHLIISEKAQKIIQRKGKTDWREEACFADGNTIYAFEMWRNGIKLSAETERNQKKNGRSWRKSRKNNGALLWPRTRDLEM